MGSAGPRAAGPTSTAYRGAKCTVSATHSQLTRRAPAVDAMAWPTIRASSLRSAAIRRATTLNCPEVTLTLMSSGMFARSPATSSGERFTNSIMANA